MIAGFLVVPARRHHPAIVSIEVPLLRPWRCGLVPGMALIHWIAHWVLFHKKLFVVPVFIVGASKQDANAEIDIDQFIRHELAIYDYAWSDKHLFAPLR